MSANKTIAKNYLYNLVFQIFTLITPLITTPYISRVLGASNIGIYSYSLSISIYFIMVGNLGYPLYGQREIAYCSMNKSKRSKVFFEVFYGQIITLTIALAAYIGYVLIFVTNYKIIYLIQSIGVLAGVVNIGWLYQGMEEFRITVRRGFFIKIFSVVLLFLLVKTSDDLVKYTIIINVANLIGNLLLFHKINKYIDLQKCGVPIKRIHNRIKPAFILGIPYYVTSLYAVIDKTMIGKITGDMAQVGYYEQSQKIVTFSMAIVTALGTVFMPRFAANIAEKDKDGLRQNLRNGLMVTCALAFPICVGLFVLSKKIVPWFFGPGYDSVGLLLKIFAPMVIFMGISNFAGNQYLVAAKKEKELTISISISVAVNLIINAILIPSFGVAGAAIATLVSEFAKLLIQAYMARGVVYWPEIIKYSMKSLLISTVMGSILFIVDQYFKLQDTLIWSLVLIALGVCIYMCMLYLTRDTVFIAGLNTVKSKVHKRR